MTYALAKLAHPAHHTPSRTDSAHSLTAVPAQSVARGFALYVGLDEAKARADGTSLNQVVQALREVIATLAPSATAHAAVALAPAGVGGNDLEIVRLALQDPKALASRGGQVPVSRDVDRRGVIIDLGRRRVVVDGHVTGVTEKEFELLQYLVLREGRAVDRAEIATHLWPESGAEGAPGRRTIDVHVRRLRNKLGEYADLVRTTRGSGYRFERHDEVAVRHAAGPSPDAF